MGLDKDDLVRLRAYALWVEDGQPEGREWEHWFRARREVEGRESAMREMAERAARREAAPPPPPLSEAAE